MIKAAKLAAAVSFIGLLATGSAASDKLKVIASFSIIGDLAKNVGGDRVNITTFVGPDSDAHAYEPKPADAAAIGGAKVVLMNGLQFEGFMERLIEVSKTEASVVVLSKGAQLIANSEEPEEANATESSSSDGHAGESEGENDPHAWQSVANVRIYVQNIADAFCAADAQGCGTYRANAQAYSVKLDELDKEIKSGVAEIPEEKRSIITSHDAFGYFAKAYGIKFMAPEGVSTESEASAADVAALIRQAKEDKAAAIFVENITNPRLIEQIASETGIKVGGTLFSDALSPPDGPASTYIDMMHNNITQIKGAILGS